MTTLPIDIHYWLAAIYLEGLGPIRLRQLFCQFSGIKNFFTASIDDLKLLGVSPKQIHSIKTPDWKKIENDLAWCEKMDCHIIPMVDERYPLLLREIADAPLVLFVRGDTTLLSKPQVAIVGSRNPTITGREHAKQFAYCLAQSSLIITSGLALGIDTASHQGALDAGGKTIAVCGNGLHHIYPISNRSIAEKIIANGALVSELPPDTPPKAVYFPMRNRVISGLSTGVLVVEAALRSGSLITARLAGEQGREVFALPGSIHNPLARGCHQLIRQGAKLVETAQDILEELGTIVAVATQNVQKSARLNTEQQSLLRQIGYEITALDAIIMRSGLTAAKVSSMLVSLELEGYIVSTKGGYVRNP